MRYANRWDFYIRAPFWKDPYLECHDQSRTYQPNKQAHGRGA
jgi:hypothetical protein